MLVAALSFLAGLLLVQQLPVLPDSVWLILGVLIALFFAVLRCWRGLFFVAGVVWALAFAMASLADRLPEPLQGQEMRVEGIIDNLPEQDEKRSRFDFVITHSEQNLPVRVRLSWYYPKHELKAGQHWAFTVKLKRPHGTLNPGGFDYERWLFTEGIGATGYVRDHPAPVFLAQDPSWRSVAVWRQDLTDQLSRLLPGRPNLALIKALIIGDDNDITQAQWEVFRKTGTIHLIVISGTHIGLIAGLVYFVVLRLWAWTGVLAWSPQRVAAMLAMWAAFFYATLAGFSVPTQRAVIMLTIVMAAIIWQRNTRPFNTLAAAMLGVLLLDPLAVLASGFWLSFLAVAVIIYAVEGRLGKQGYFYSALKINWATTVALSPLLLFCFQQVSLIAPLANLIAVPVISILAVPLLLLAVIIMFIVPAAAIQLFLLVDTILQGLWWFLSFFADMPLAVMTHAQPSIWALLFAIPGILIVLAPAGIPGRWLGLVMFLPMIFTAQSKPQVGSVRMTLLDVGQGLSAVVQTANHWLVYDAGVRFSAQSDIGKTVLLPFLHAQGVKQIDRLIISHGDNDHIGGAESLLHAMNVGQVMTSVPEQLSDYRPIRCVAGQSWLWDDVKFIVLAPKIQGFVTENDNSCVLQIQAQQGALLLTGDIEATAESWLVETYGGQLKANVLISPHHGSKTSSSPVFLRAVQPDLVLIPAGYGNQFGFPHPIVVSRYQDLNAQWLNTADSGAIDIQEKDNAWIVQSWRGMAAKYWNDR
jgi:competence protein ComEC